MPPPMLLSLALALVVSQADAGVRVEDGVKVVPVFVPPVGTPSNQPANTGPGAFTGPGIAPGTRPTSPSTDGGWSDPPLLPSTPSSSLDAGMFSLRAADAGLRLLPDGGPSRLPDGGHFPVDAGAGGLQPGQVNVRLGVEVTGLALPSGTPDGLMDGFASLSPMFGIDAGDDFDGELGATFNLRLIDSEPIQRGDDIGGLLRRKDWDEGSDFGQILKRIRIGLVESGLWVTIGQTKRKRLGLGHLIDRYSNRDNVDYHPASTTIGMAYGVLSAEVFLSDLLGERIYAGELAWDLGRTFSKSPDAVGKHHLAVSVAHDVGVAGAVGVQQAVVDRKATLAHTDFSTTFWSSTSSRFLGLVGVGIRFNETYDMGGLLGLSFETQLGTVALGTRLELRKQAGGFRHNYFGFGYELARFAAIGLTGPGRAAERLPDAVSVALEGQVAIGQWFTFSAFGELFTWGRTDVDLLLAWQFAGDRVVGAARLSISGLGQVERYQANAELRVRFLKSLYLLAQGGTVFFPQRDASLVRGVFVNAGAGVDFGF